MTKRWGKEIQGHYNIKRLKRFEIGGKLLLRWLAGADWLRVSGLQELALLCPGTLSQSCVRVFSDKMLINSIIWFLAPGILDENQNRREVQEPDHFAQREGQLIPPQPGRGRRRNANTGLRFTLVCGFFLQPNPFPLPPFTSRASRVPFYQQGKACSTTQVWKTVCDGLNREPWALPSSLFPYMIYVRKFSWNEIKWSAPGLEHLCEATWSPAFCVTLSGVAGCFMNRPI
jgi:hypothetical protein